MGRGLKALIFGGAIGATLGVLYAPRAGKKTREMIAEKTEAIWGDEAQKKGTILSEVAKTTKSAVSAGQSVISNANKEKIANIKKDVQKVSSKIAKDTTKKVDDFKTESVRPAFSNKNDDLRKKIDVARAKIASQVATNIDDDEKKKKTVKTQSTKTAAKASTDAKTAKKKVVKKK